MIRVDISEQFPILVSLLDETTGTLVSGRTVTYDVRDLSDNVLSPPVAGTLSESSYESGVYRGSGSITSAGTYVCYATCSGFITNTEEIIVNPENIYTLVKQNRYYNISVQDVARTNGSPTSSQTVRNVPLNKTDYVVTVIKRDSDSDWVSTTTSGVVYAWYDSVDSNVPYKMGGST